MGAGRAIVSTPFAHAAELLADGRGLLVPAATPALMASAVNEVLADDPLRAAMGRAAYEYSRRMVWSDVGSVVRSYSGSRTKDRGALMRCTSTCEDADLADARHHSSPHHLRCKARAVCQSAISSWKKTRVRPRSVSLIGRGNAPCRACSMIWLLLRPQSFTTSFNRSICRGPCC